MTHATSHGARHHKAAWVVATILALVFIPMGLVKLAGLDSVRGLFLAWGYETWFMYAIGVLEVSAGVAVLVPRLATYAAGYLVVEMLGALVTHLVHAEALIALLPLAVGALALYEMWARIPDAAGTQIQAPIRA